MDKELRDKWINELRNPDNKQTQEILIGNSGARCCLGVLCDVLGLERAINEDNTPYGYYYSPPTPFEDPEYNEPYDREFYDTELHLSLLTEIGLTVEQQRTLVSMNDAQMYTFPEIADWVQENL